MPTDQPPEPDHASSRRRFLFGATGVGALVTAGVVSSPLAGLLPTAGAQGSGATAASGTLVDADFAAFATPLELAAVQGYQAVLDTDLLDTDWTTLARQFQSHHQQVADVLGAMVDANADTPVPDQSLLTTLQDQAGNATNQDVALQVLAGLENKLSATHLAAVPELKDPVTARTVTQVLTVEAQQAALLTVGGGGSVAEATPAVATTNDAVALPN